MKKLSKTYSPKGMEERLYKKWEEKGYFHAEPDPKKRAFTIVMPPPNITGQLHMGHALDNTMQDILIRYRRMQGFSALWQPGTDHAAIATEVRVTESLKERGIDKENLSRDEFLKYAWEWKEEYGERIETQLKKLGSSADWARSRFTMDEGCTEAVKEVFIRLFDKGYIYKGSRIIHWCPLCGTSISDAEVEHTERAGHFWHIRYPIVGAKDEYVEIATTRPETMLGDTAVAVHPEDERYAHLVGQRVLLPLVGREIPVIADEYVDREFGTGCVKITPAHDPNDFEVGRRHGLEEINILNDDATINQNGGSYEGMDRYEARRAIVSALESEGYLVRIEDHVHNVGIHDRCHTVVEPMIKPQWFVRMDEMAKPAMEALKSGELRFVPESFGKTYMHWLEEIRDWCISRQLLWGHRIPAYYCSECGHMCVSKDAPDKCPNCAAHSLIQDEDTLDTWFSSALWPFSTLGWPKDTEELKYFYPTDVLVTGYDIIFFWVIRMVFSAIEQTGKLPFHTVLIHGLVRDAQGRKMSKSLGNGIDPIAVIEKYGADALRLTLVSGSAPGSDMRFHWEKAESFRNFANKVWNASRFILMNLGDKEPGKPDDKDLRTEDKWILSKVSTLASEVTENMEKYELGIAVQKVYDFIWEEFCDWYIEIVKPRLKGEASKGAADAAQASGGDILKDAGEPALWVLKSVLGDALKLLHPFMPFISEEIYCALHPEEESIMCAPWPMGDDAMRDTEAERSVEEVLKASVRGVRNLKANMQVHPGKSIQASIVCTEEDVLRRLGDVGGTIAHLISARSISIQPDKSGIPEDAATVVIPGAVIYIPLDELVDMEKERERLEKESERLSAELSRCDGMLRNEKFQSRAPREKVEAERRKRAKYEKMKKDVEERLSQLQARA